MADGTIFESAIIYTTLKKFTNIEKLFLNLPFKYYAANIYRLNEDITYDLFNKNLIDKEIIAKIDYHIDDKKQVLLFNGYIGINWDIVKNNLKFLQHYSVKKEDYLSIKDNLGRKTLYTGLDKLDIVPFTNWYNSNISKDNYERTNLTKESYK